MERILSRVEIDPESHCWVYTGQLTLGDSGYGHIGVDRTRKVVHRVVYEATVGPIPDGLEIDHLCENTPCCNPDHLEVVTHAENVRRREASRRRQRSVA
jgi:hypothetical protein